MAINISKAVSRALTPPKSAKKVVDEQLSNLTSIESVSEIDVNNALVNVALATTAGQKFNFLDSLKSRKFWLTAGFAVVVILNAKFGHLLNNEDLLLILGATGGFVGVEGIADIISRLQANKAESEGE